MGIERYNGNNRKLTESGVISLTVRIETIKDLLDQREWEACSKIAERGLTESQWSAPDKAFLNFALLRSLSHLERYSAALQYGQLAVYLAGEVKEYDLLGRSLLELAWAQHKVQGMERWAPDTQRRFFSSFELYKDKTIRDQYLSAMYNLGVYLRTAGMYAEALEQLKKTYLEARKRGNHDLADLARSSAAWEALRLERIAEAEELVSQGEAYKPTDPRLQVSHQLDRAQLALLKGKIHAAGSLAFQAALQCEGSPDFLARAMEIILKAADREGEGELALIAGIVGKLQAELDDRHDIMSQIAAQVQVLALRYPEAVERLMATIDDPK